MSEEAAPSVAPPADGGPSRPVATSRFRELHARTFEMELLLSGAVLLALLQLPRLLLAGLELARARFDADAATAAAFVYVYAGFSLYTLIATFVLHLLGRGLWIALVGLESVFPDGVAWDKLQVGPATRRIYERHVPRLAPAIDRLDDLCSLAFSAAAALVALVAYSVLLLGVCGLAALAAAPWAGRGRTVAMAVFLLVFGLHLAARSIDKRWGERLASRPASRRRLERLVAAAYWTSVLPWIGNVLLVFQSRISRKRLGVLYFAWLGAVIAAVLAPILIRDGDGLDGRRFFFFGSGPDAVAPRHYRDARGDGPRPLVPSLQSDVVVGPYVELFVPYRPRRHNAAMERLCTGLAPVADLADAGLAPADEPRVRASADCLASLHRLTLDGGEIAPRFDFGRDADLAGLVAYLPAAGLAPGRHELVVQEVFDVDPPVGGVAGAEPAPGADRRRWVIPFWR